MGHQEADRHKGPRKNWIELWLGQREGRERRREKGWDKLQAPGCGVLAR